MGQLRIEVELCTLSPVIDVQSVKSTVFAEAIERVTLNDGRHRNLRWRVPADRHMRVGTDRHLADAVAARHKDLQADRRRSPHRRTLADVRGLDLASHAAERVRVEQVGGPGFALDKHQAAGQRRRAHRAEVRVSAIVLRPLFRCKTVL